MAIYEFAGMRIKVNNRYDSFRKLAAEYLVSGDDFDFEVTVDDDDIQREREISKTQHPFDFPNGYLEEICIYRKIVEEAANFNTFMLHGAVFTVGEHCLCLSALSGTGKTTHMRMWQELLGDKLTVINGDKPLIRLEDGKPVAYGTPYNGKENYGTKAKAVLTDLCFIERAKDNSVEKLRKDEVIDRIMNQAYMPQNAVAALNVLDMVDKLLAFCNLWLIKCNPTVNAAEVAYKTIIEQKTVEE